MYKIPKNPNRYYQIMHNYQEAQLLFTAIQLDIFSFLDTPQTVDTIARETNCDKIQMGFLLLSLASCGFVEKQGEFYINTFEAASFLSRSSDIFLGDTLLFREKMTSLANLEKKLQTPPSANKTTYNFSELARLTIPEIYTGRVQAFMEEINKLYPNSNDPLHILDLGGGAGIFDIEFIKQFPNSKATILETPEVSKVTRETVKQYQLQQKIEVIAGNFNSNPFGGPYDIIIASGIINFVDGNLVDFIKKISDSLKDGGYLFLIGNFEYDKNHIPTNMLSWLSGFLEGIPMPPSAEDIEAALHDSGLTFANRIKISMFEGHLYQKSRSDFSVHSSEVIDSFIVLTEKIANSKTNILDFGSEEMTFYRGEIHMIKTIGDYPGIHSAELARKYGITRTVVHKTLQKLKERGLIIKLDDPDNKKRSLLYLTEKGQIAYSAHKKYHDEYDKSLFDFLAYTTDDKLAAMKNFLDYAIGLIENHS